jgi:hypothetical protein
MYRCFQGLEKTEQEGKMTKRTKQRSDVSTAGFVLGLDSNQPFPIQTSMHRKVGKTYKIDFRTHMSLML